MEYIAIIGAAVIGAAATIVAAVIAARHHTNTKGSRQPQANGSRTASNGAPARLKPQDTQRRGERKPPPKRVATPPPSGGSFVLQVTDRTGLTHELEDVFIRYPSTFGPRTEKRGIRVRQGTLQSFVEWAKVKRITFKHFHDTSAPKVKYRYEVQILFTDNTTMSAEVVEDWNLKAGQSGLLFGQTSLGNSQLGFADIGSIAVTSSSDAGQ